MVPHSQSLQQSRGLLAFITMFKLAVTIVALAVSASAAHIKRVTCPDGNVTSNEAVSIIYRNSSRYGLLIPRCLSVLRLLRPPR